MQFAIRARERVERTVNVTVEWFDSAVGFNYRSTLNFHIQDGETALQVRQRIRAEIERIGQEFRQALAMASALDNDVDVVRNVP